MVELFFDRVEWLGVNGAVFMIVAVAVFAFALLTIFAATMRTGQRGKGRVPAAVQASRRPELPTPTETVSAAAEVADDPRAPGLRSRSKRRIARLRGRVRRSPLTQGRLLFLSRWARGPMKIGSITPSSRGLGRAMAAQLPDAYDVCVELGGGTGSLTRSLLAAGVPASKLVVLERDPQLATYLRRKFSGVQVIEGDAQSLTALLRAHGIESVDSIISSLPLRSMPRGVRGRIVSECFAALSEDGSFVQFTYGLNPPVPEEVSAELALEALRTTRVWRNIPPASVWRYQRAA